MPFEGLRGSKYVGYREAALAQPQFRAVNEASSTGHGIIQPFDEATAIIDHDIDIDRAIVDRHGPERRNYETRMGVTAFARLWVDTFVKGDRSTNGRVFDGLNVRATLFGRLYNNSTASGGAPLSLFNLDQVINNVSTQSGTTYIFMSFHFHPALDSGGPHDLVDRLRHADMGRNRHAEDELCAAIASCFGYPKSDQVPVLQFNEVAKGGGSAVTASLYVMTLGEGMLRGIQVRPLQPEDVGIAARPQDLPHAYLVGRLDRGRAQILLSPPDIMDQRRNRRLTGDRATWLDAGITRSTPIC